MMCVLLLPIATFLLRAEVVVGIVINNNNNNNHHNNNNNNGNTDKWISDKDKYWSKFRDDDYFRTWSPSKAEDKEPEDRPRRHGEPGFKTHPAQGKWRTDDGLDITKDPCMKVRCPPHKVCVSHDLQMAICTNHKPPQQHSIKPRKGSHLHKHWMGTVNHGNCRPCPVVHPTQVCGSDGHTYSSKCKLEFQACVLGKSILVMCDGPCPCLPGQEFFKPHTEKNVCSDTDLKSLASRLKDWFGVLHMDANRDLKISANDNGQGRFDTSILPICKDSLGWMFNKLDMNYDLLLDQSELSAIYLDKYELCMRPLFNSCDSFKDGKLSNNEWCYCFQKPDGLPCQNEINRIHAQSRRKSLIGAYVPRCMEDGYFKATQCHGSTGQCWCVDKYGNEIAGSRKQGNPICEEDQETSGDYGSGGAVIILDDQEEEEEEPPQNRPRRQKEKRGRLHPHGAIDDDDDEEDDKEDEIGYTW